jgi:hypothetical protein
MSIELFSPLVLRSGDGGLAVAVVEEVERALEQGRVV